MSVHVNVGTLSMETRQKFARDLVVRQTETAYRKNPPVMYPYTITDSGDGAFPFAYMRSLGYKNNRRYKKARAFEFDGALRPPQEHVRNKAIKYMNATGSCVLSMYPGFGKTAIAIEIAQRVRLKTIVIVNRVVLVNQWRESIQKFCPLATISTSYTTRDDTDFVIVNAQNVCKIDDLDRFGFVIVDEVHMIVTETLSKCLRMLFPKYTIGLSATPYRSDGMDRLIDLHFGENKIVKKLNRKHTVYVVNTGFVPEMKLSRHGKPDWNSVVESQAASPMRIELIRCIVEKFPDRNFLILCKRIEQAASIADAINEPVSRLYSDKQSYDKSNRILVATAQKAGVGFDDSSIDALILASDIQEYFIQYLGRCMRTPEVIPLVFDLVDNNRILKKHFAVRKKVYTESGGTIVSLKL